jgi:hypothetical protein
MYHKREIEFNTTCRNAGTWYRILIPLLGTTINFNAILNFFIYTGRHHDMRLGAKYLFKCKVRYVRFSNKILLYTGPHQARHRGRSAEGEVDAAEARWSRRRRQTDA